MRPTEAIRRHRRSWVSRAPATQPPPWEKTIPRDGAGSPSGAYRRARTPPTPCSVADTPATGAPSTTRTVHAIVARAAAGSRPSTSESRNRSSRPSSAAISSATTSPSTGPVDVRPRASRRPRNRVAMNAPPAGPPPATRRRWSGESATPGAYPRPGGLHLGRMPPVHLGIDLGTTNSTAAAFDGAELTLIRNAQGGTLTPSIVRIDARGGVVV